MLFPGVKKEIAAVNGAAGKMKTFFSNTQSRFLLLKERNKFKNQAL